MLTTGAALGALGAARPDLSAATWAQGDDLALAVAWIVAFAASAWLFVTSAACALALGCARPSLAGRLAGMCPSGIRRWVEVAIVGSCIALPALPARAATPPTTATTAVAVVADQPVVHAPQAPAIAPAPAPAPLPAAPTQQVVVRPGDNLWLIARTSLANAPGRPPTDAEVARYWRAVIAANRPTLRSGDPSLIFPGEIVALPPTTAVS